MGLLNAVIQNEGMNRQLPGKFAEQTKKIIDRKRLSQLGNAFDEWPDKSAGGIEKFGQTYKATLPEMNALVKLYSGYAKNQREIAGPDVPMYQKGNEGIVSRNARPGQVEGLQGEGFKFGSLKPASTSAKRTKIDYWEPPTKDRKNWRKRIAWASDPEKKEQELIKQGNSLTDKTKGGKQKTEYEVREDLNQLRMAYERFSKTGGIGEGLLSMLATTESGRGLADKIRNKPDNAEQYFSEQEEYLKSLLPGQAAQSSIPSWRDIQKEIKTK